MESQEHLDTSAPEGKGKGARTRRKAGVKAPTESGKRSLNLRVDDDTYERLTVHAMKRKTTISELVMEFSRVHLREYSIHRNGSRNEGGS